MIEASHIKSDIKIHKNLKSPFYYYTIGNLILIEFTTFLNLILTITSSSPNSFPHCKIDSSRTDLWTMLKGSWPCSVENPCIIFDYPQTLQLSRGIWGTGSRTPNTCQNPWILKLFIKWHRPINAYSQNSGSTGWIHRCETQGYQGQYVYWKKFTYK